jgi:hypothetical protein
MRRAVLVLVLYLVLAIPVICAVFAYWAQSGPSCQRAVVTMSGWDWTGGLSATICLVGPIAAIFALARVFKRDERLNTEACVRCGYDLRGSPGPCSECGHE